MLSKSREELAFSLYIDARQVLANGAVECRPIPTQGPITGNFPSSDTQILEPFQPRTISIVVLSEGNGSLHPMHMRPLSPLREGPDTGSNGRRKRYVTYDAKRSKLASSDVSVEEADLIVAGQEARGIRAAEGWLVRYICVAGVRGAESVSHISYAPRHLRSFPKLKKRTRTYKLRG